MKKFYKKIPLHLREKIQQFSSDSFKVAVVIKLYKTQISSNELIKFGIWVDDQGNYNCKSIVPQPSLGKHSKKNSEGWTEIHKDMPKVTKSYSLGERPIYGDWSNGSFDLTVTRNVYQRTEHSPSNFEIVSSLIDESQDQDGEFGIFKIEVGTTMSRNDRDFEQTTLNILNLLHETVGKIDVFDIQASKLDHLSSLSVDWEIFPPGKRDLDIRKIVGTSRNLTDEQYHEFIDRFDTIRSLNPVRYIKGLGGSSAYFGALLKDDLIVFENIKYGNALYILYEDWQDVSKLSRTEILSGNYDYERIIHSSNWKTNLYKKLGVRIAA